MITIAFLNQNFLMQKEILAALGKIPGINILVIAISDIPTEQDAENLCQHLTQQQCRILFSVNDWGIDRYAITASYCQKHSILHVNWCADDPFFLATMHSVPLVPYANRFDFVSDRSYVDAMRQKGLKAYFLPLAADPSLFASTDSPLTFSHTVSFVGNSYAKQIEEFTKGKEEFIDSFVPFVTSLLMQFKISNEIDIAACISREIANRELPVGLEPEKACFILKHLISYFYRKGLILSLYKTFDDFMVFGDEWWLLDLPKERISTSVGYYINLCETYRTTKINIDINRIVIREGLTQRVFDCLSSGAFVITSKKAILSEFFITQGDKQEVVMFETEQHLLDLVKYYSIHDDERSAIVARGRQRVLAEHSYSHRIGTIFSVLSKELGKM